MIKEKSNSVIEDGIYPTSKVFKINMGILAGFFLFLGILLNFPLKEVIKTKIATAISSMHSCPMNYDQLEVSYLMLPNIEMKELQIDGRCFQSQRQPLKIDQLAIKFRGPSFMPFGIRFLIEAKIGTSIVETYLSVGFNKYVIKFPETILDGKLFTKLNSGKRVIDGKIIIEGLLGIEANQIKSGDLLIRSVDLKIPSQVVAGLALPEMRIGTLAFKGSIQKNSELEITDFLLGNDFSPIVAQAKGTVILNSANMSYSRPNITGKVKFSKEFQSQFPILNLLLSGKNPEAGFYNFQLLGNFVSPNFSIK